jgi:hypothetical protein
MPTTTRTPRPIIRTINLQGRRPAIETIDLTPRRRGQDRRNMSRNSRSQPNAEQSSSASSTRSETADTEDVFAGATSHHQGPLKTGIAAAPRRKTLRKDGKHIHPDPVAKAAMVLSTSESLTPVVAAYTLHQHTKALVKICGHAYTRHVDGSCVPLEGRRLSVGLQSTLLDEPISAS